MIDWERLNELISEVGEESFAEVAEVFLEEVAEVIDRLKANPAPESLESELHFLKGSALNLGFKTLGKLCHDGEQHAASGDYGAISLAPLFDAYDKSCVEFTDKMHPQLMALG